MRFNLLTLSFVLMLGCLVGQAALAQVPPPPAGGDALVQKYTGRAYSPYAERDFPGMVYWGDTHLHTSFSMDAGAFGNRLGLDEAYKFARGEQVTSSSGQPVRLSRPLDFLVVADHSDGMGLFPDLIAGKEHIVSDPTGKDWYDRIHAGEGVGVALELIGMFSQGKMPEALIYKPDSAPYRSAWGATVAAAERFNAPGIFTAFIGYEWTSLVTGNNMHRVVVYRDGGEKGGQMVPYTTYPPEGSANPRDLWAWLERYEKQTQGDVLAIPHNGNLANGIMFPLEAQYDGKVLDKEYVTKRATWEPLYEITQIKGDGEAHPFLSPNDEFADYENWDIGNLDVSEAKTNDMLAGEYGREALKRGLTIETKLGTNPYQFGLIGSTDSHTSLATTQENNFFGKHAGAEPKADRMTHPFMETDQGTIMGWQQVASGLAGVWATENTREALFDAMERKEVYATTGSRMMVRFFGGWEYAPQDVNSREPVFAGYDKGVPMGGTLRAKPAGASAPTFMVWALRDPIGANLDRVQIIKGWLGKDGETHEKVYDVVWSGDRKPGADGKLPPVGNTVDVKTANWTNTIGASELGTVWSDPDFDPAQKAFYYSRVLEIPKPRWSTYEAFRLGVPIPEGAPVSTQDRAYTSPIWYAPEG
ncbi:MAG: DUF3604 domain-containing protein [Deltaproteobacteria bacterium]|nr:DUF3604 domain-containing protein [Deltaproteobacteria bacterium]MBW2393893.1 DUF3604 domain-containing protein [Deltaproteobacteria bacterium]